MIPKAQPDNTTIEIVETSPEAICLTNRNSFAVDISGWKLTGAGIQHQLRPGTVIPAGLSLQIVPEVAAFRKRHPERASTFVQGNWKGTFTGVNDLQLTDTNGRTVTKESPKPNQHSTDFVSPISKSACATTTGLPNEACALIG